MGTSFWCDKTINLDGESVLQRRDLDLTIRSMSSWLGNNLPDMRHKKLTRLTFGSRYRDLANACGSHECIPPLSLESPFQ